MATAEKAPPADTEKVEAWLSENDEALFLSRARITDTRKRYEALHGVSVTARQFKKAREACKYCKKIRRRKPPVSTSLTESQWTRIRVWAEHNLDVIQGVRSIEMAAQLAIHDGIPASPRLLRNSVSFMAVWKQFHGPENPSPASDTAE